MPAVPMIAEWYLMGPPVYPTRSGGAVPALFLDWL